MSAIYSVLILAALAISPFVFAAIGACLVTRVYDRVERKRLERHRG